MNYKIIEKKDNNLLKREEIILEIDSPSCPKKDEILDELKLNKDVSVVKKIYSFFGKRKFRADVFVYKTKENKEKIEKIPRKIRKKNLEEAKKQETKISGG